jgi:hypothetical protein
MFAAIPGLAFGMAVLFCAGCAPLLDSSPGLVLPVETTEPVTVAILPPVVSSRLTAEKMEAEAPWYEQLMDGRGSVVASANPRDDAALLLAATLSQAKKYKRVFLALDAGTARDMGADRILRWTIHDYRSVLLGGNSRYGWLILCGPAMPQYWIRWLTVEARLDWEVDVADASSGDSVFHHRQKTSYYKTVTYALLRHMDAKMLRLLLYEATPKHVCDLFLLKMAPVPKEGETPPPPAPGPVPAAGDAASAAGGTPPPPVAAPPGITQIVYEHNRAAGSGEGEARLLRITATVRSERPLTEAEQGFLRMALLRVCLQLRTELGRPATTEEDRAQALELLREEVGRLPLKGIEVLDIAKSEGP